MVPGLILVQTSCSVLSFWQLTSFLVQASCSVLSIWQLTLISTITKKASSTLGFLYRNLQFCPPSSRKTAYISLVHSALKYSTVAWDPYQQNDIDKLENIQRHEAHFMIINQNYKEKDCLVYSGSPGKERISIDSSFWRIYSITQWVVSCVVYHYICCLKVHWVSRFDRLWEFIKL